MYTDIAEIQREGCSIFWTCCNTRKWGIVRLARQGWNTRMENSLDRGRIYTLTPFDIHTQRIQDRDKYVCA